MWQKIPFSSFLSYWSSPEPSDWSCDPFSAKQLVEILWKLQYYQVQYPNGRSCISLIMVKCVTAYHYKRSIKVLQKCRCLQIIFSRCKGTCWFWCRPPAKFTLPFLYFFQWRWKIPTKICVTNICQNICIYLAVTSLISIVWTVLARAWG